MIKLGATVSLLAMVCLGFGGGQGGCMPSPMTAIDPVPPVEAAAESTSSTVSGAQSGPSENRSLSLGKWEYSFDNVPDSGEPSDWLSTGADNSMSSVAGLFAVGSPLSSGGVSAGGRAYGTDDTGTNTHSHYMSDESPDWSNYEFAGRMMRSSAGGGVGVTFLSDYPHSDHYYRLRAYGSHSFELEPHGTSLTGTVISSIPANPGAWYRFRVQAVDSDGATHVRAKVWLEGSREPGEWQLDAEDQTSARRRTGTVGMWSMGTGGKWIDDLSVTKLVVDPGSGAVISADAGDDQTLIDNDDDGLEQVSLDGSASQGDIDQYSWIEGGEVLASSASSTATVELPIGRHVIELEASHQDMVATDTVIIDVQASPYTDCETSRQGWQNFSTAAQSDLCTVRFVGIPHEANMDGLFAMSQGAGNAYRDFAILVRFNVAGTIDARDGGAYSADSTVTYQPEQAYAFRVEVDCVNKAYDVYVTPPDGIERRVAHAYAFRSEQSGVSALDNWAIQAGAGSHDICGITVQAGATNGPQPPVADAGADQTVVDMDDDGVEDVQLDARDSYDPDGEIVNYEWSEGTQVLASGASPTASVPLAIGTHAITLRVTDDSAREDTDAVVVTVNAPGGDPTMQSSISRHGITWTFDREYEVGEFVNGDYYVVGPVTVTAISPAPGGGRNGSMINPAAEDVQAYDNRAYNYDAGQGVAPPFTLAVNQSLVSTKSANDGHTNLETAAVLTCLADAPAAGTFRPPYCGDSKPLHNASDLQMHLLPNLPPVAGTPSVDTVAGRIERVWLDHQPNWYGKYLHPQLNMPHYGREISTEIGEAALMTLLDVPNKDILVIRLVQLGIDFNGIADAGGGWIADGGHSSGRKWPIIFAGYMLDDTHMLNIGYRDVPFGEDCQTFYVSQADVDRGVGYTQSNLGMAEWGIRHCYAPDQDSSAWDTPYRECCTANAWVGSVLSAHLLGLTDAWNHAALFDYEDRYMSTEPSGNFRSWSPFAETMWDTYR